MLRETKSRSPISRNVRCVGSRRTAGHRDVGAFREGLAQLRDLVDECSKSGPVVQDVVDFPQEVPRGPMVGDGRVHLRQLQAYAYGDERESVRTGRPGPHG